MRCLTLSSLAFLCLGTPCLAADLDGPVYGEREVYVDRPPVVIEKRIIEHHYYEPAPVYSAPRVYYAPRVYTDAYYERPNYGYRYVDSGWRPRYFFPRGPYWHRHHHDW
jgi:hypothetical protein